MSKLFLHSKVYDYYGSRLESWAPNIANNSDKGQSGKVTDKWIKLKSENWHIHFLIDFFFLIQFPNIATFTMQNNASHAWIIIMNHQHSRPLYLFAVSARAPPFVAYH